MRGYNAAMKRDNLKQFVALRESLLQEKAELEHRLAQINEVLSGASPTGTGAPSQRSGRRKRNELSLRDAIVQVTSAKPLTKEDVLEAVQKLGYEFSTAKPLNSVSTVLYGKKPKFTKKDGKFSPVQ